MEDAPAPMSAFACLGFPYPRLDGYTSITRNAIKLNFGGLLMFTVDQEFVRKKLHDDLGGNRQSGISNLPKYPMVLLFTGESKDIYGYHDHWAEDGAYMYYGQGRTGDMTMSRGNKSIRDHVQNGKTLHLFEKTKLKSIVRYVGQFRCDGLELRPSSPAMDGRARESIVFRLILDD